MLAAAGGLVKAVGGPDAIAIAIAAIGVVGALFTLGFVVLQQRAVKRENEEALWRPGTAPTLVRDTVASDGIYELGVESEAPEALAAVGLEQQRHAPYAPREVDERLRERLTAAAAQAGVTLVIVRGPSKAGKSRTALNALDQAMPNAWLLVPKDRAALAQLARSGVPRGIGPGACIVWLDDIELFATSPSADGLNAATIKNLNRWSRPVVLLATAGGKGGQLTGSDQYAEPTRDLLRAHPPFELNPWLSPKEEEMLAALGTYSRDAAHRIAPEGIGEFMIAAPKLRERLDEGAKNPEGLAVTQAAVDWRRAGLIRPVPAAALRSLYVHYLRGPHSEARFEAGLAWATEALYSSVSLLQGTAEYEPYDYIVLYERRRKRSIPNPVWDDIITEHADDAELSSVGIAAVEKGSWGAAERAFRRGDDRGSAVAAFNLGTLLRRGKDMEGAEAAWRRADERGSAQAAYNLGVRLEEIGDVEAAEAAWRRADERGSGEAAYNLGRLLFKRSDTDGAEAAWRRADDRGSAEAAHNLGVLLWKRGDMQEAETVLRRADYRGSAGAAYRLGIMLEERGDLPEAEDAWRRSDEAGSAKAALFLSFVLVKRGDLKEAETVLRRADDRGLAEAAYSLALLLEDRGDLEGAEAALVRADDRGSAQAAFRLGRLLEERGDLQEAEAAMRRADERGSAHGAHYLGVLLRRRGAMEEADSVFRRARDRHDAEQFELQEEYLRRTEADRPTDDASTEA